MSVPRIQIDQLCLRVPGLSREQARHLAEVVARRLADLPLDGNGVRSIPALAVRVTGGTAFSIERTADEIVAGIRRGLRKG